jgi:hypothetical protein
MDEQRRTSVPWTAGYRSPAVVEGAAHVALTPCHQRRVRREDADVSEFAAVRCPACSRLWDLRFGADALGPVADWVA